MAQRWDRETAKDKAIASRNWQIDGPPSAWDWQAVHKFLGMSGYTELCVGASYRKGATCTWTFWAVQPSGTEDCMEIQLVSGKLAYVNPAFGTATKRRAGAKATKTGAGGATIYHATNPLKQPPPKPVLVPEAAKPKGDAHMAAEGDSPSRKGSVAATAAREQAKAMHVPAKVEKEKQEAMGGGKCCCDAFAQMYNFLMDGKEQRVTHVETRSAAVQGCRTRRRMDGSRASGTVYFRTGVSTSFRAARTPSTSRR